MKEDLKMITINIIRKISRFFSRRFCPQK